MNTININGIFENFVARIKNHEIDIYNEFSLQHEFGIFLRDNLNDRKIQFERNVSYFDICKTNKKEIDVSIFLDSKNPEVAIELKFPRNGQYPEQMYKFLEDIMFLEKIVGKGKFKSGYAIIFVDDSNFYDQKRKIDGIYKYFRINNDTIEPITGKIQKPTGKKCKNVLINGNYQINWHQVNSKIRYAVIEVGSCPV